VSWSVLLHLFVAFLDLPLLIVLVLVTFLIGFRSEHGGQLFDRTSVSLVALWFLLPVGALGAASLLLGVNLLFDRYVLYILPAGLLVATGVAALGRREGWRGLVPFLTLLVFSFSWSLIPSVQRTGGFAERYDEDWTAAVASLESIARPGDVILYGTAFAEADQLRLLAPKPLILSFIRVPLTANLRPGRKYTLLGLPFRVNDETRPYVLSVMRQASAGRHVLIIGLGDAVAEATKMLIATGGFTPMTLTPHGLVRVIVLERKEG
jgi:hypothetical protein